MAGDDLVKVVLDLGDFNDTVVPYLWAARRAAIYRAKVRGSGMSWKALADALGMRETNVRAAVARHCRDTGDPWPPRAGSYQARPTKVRDLRHVRTQ